jgi:phage baseplate assembly protein W
MPITSSFPEHTGVATLGANWRVQFADADGIPLNMVSFEVIDFGAISYKEIFQNVKTILATPVFSAALERTLGIDQSIVDRPIDEASLVTVAILDALAYWEPRCEVMNIDFDYSDALNGHLGVNLQLKIKNVIYGTNQPYERTHIFETPTKVTQELPPMNIPVAGPPGPAGPTGLTGQRGSLWYQGAADPPVTGLTPDPLPNDMYLNTTSGDVFQFNGALWAFQLNVKKAMKR